MKILAKVPCRKRSYLPRQTVPHFPLPLCSVTVQAIVLSKTLINYKEMKNEKEN